MLAELKEYGTFVVRGGVGVKFGRDFLESVFVKGGGKGQGRGHGKQSTIPQPGSGLLLGYILFPKELLWILLGGGPKYLSLKEVMAEF